MELYTYEEIEKEIEVINLDFKLSLKLKQFDIEASGELLNRLFALAKHFKEQSKFKRVFKRMSVKRKLDNLAIEIFKTPVQL
ncbi:hypothetical protein JTZ62_05120 [Mammaliicoccus sciuri]|uniref:hypothetical protein n=1 Tax=Mammaliicoccus sciuri TaxID=1296 RepID=UPI0019D3486E|nr:hypothetical protein [Mammaliicoccus sciuri]QSN68540.1 hypothetical protein JTZ62_05120 [Mammaliicoccus sciuri]UIU23283.1 hypothetical protein LLZ87_05135 [Mammaliicoccus sciuri]UIU26189.1 hypothetical protein LLZ92_05135 [Mammaliicoccus sciuri]